MTERNSADRLFPGLDSLMAEQFIEGPRTKLQDMVIRYKKRTGYKFAVLAVDDDQGKLVEMVRDLAEFEITDRKGATQVVKIQVLPYHVKQVDNGTKNHLTGAVTINTDRGIERRKETGIFEMLRRAYADGIPVLIAYWDINLTEDDEKTVNGVHLARSTEEAAKAGIVPFLVSEFLTGYSSEEDIAKLSNGYRFYVAPLGLLKDKVSPFRKNLTPFTLNRFHTSFAARTALEAMMQYDLAMRMTDEKYQQLVEIFARCSATVEQAIRDMDQIGTDNNCWGDMQPITTTLQEVIKLDTGYKGKPYALEQLAKDLGEVKLRKLRITRGNPGYEDLPLIVNTSFDRSMYLKPSMRTLQTLLVRVGNDIIPYTEGHQSVLVALKGDELTLSLSGKLKEGDRRSLDTYAEHIFTGISDVLGGFVIDHQGTINQPNRADRIYNVKMVFKAGDVVYK